MAYTTTSLDSFAIQLGNLLDDPSEVYWTRAEKILTIQEALLEWGGLTNYWRARGVISITPSSSSFTDLSLSLPTLRTRSWTLDQLVKQIQYSLLEAPNGISGSGMSGQVTVNEILVAIQRARDRFVLDVHLPLSLHTVFGDPPPPEGLVTFPQSTVFLHRVSWQDSFSGLFTNLWREDAWSIDKSSPDWTLRPGVPGHYSEAELSPLQLQLSPPPVSSGTLEALTVDSLSLDLSDPAQTFNIPDEWVHGIRFGALAQVLGGGGQITDPLRAKYCEERYQQTVGFAKEARSILRVLVNGIPLPMDSLAALDQGSPFWRSQPVDLSRPGVLASALYDFLILPPALYSAGISIDVVQSCPIPLLGTDFIPLGEEDLDNLVNECTHLLLLKCGGNEFTSTLGDHDDFVRAAAKRGSITKAKVRYFEPLFANPQAEGARRPDIMETASA